MGHTPQCVAWVSPCVAAIQIRVGAIRFTKVATDIKAKQAPASPVQAFLDRLTCFRPLVANTAVHQAIIIGVGRQVIELPISMDRHVPSKTAITAPFCSSCTSRSLDMPAHF